VEAHAHACLKAGPQRLLQLVHLTWGISGRYDDRCLQRSEGSQRVFQLRLRGVSAG
jgi:hypothetical protein